MDQPTLTLPICLHFKWHATTDWPTPSNETCPLMGMLFLMKHGPDGPLLHLTKPGLRWACAIWRNAAPDGSASRGVLSSFGFACWKRAQPLSWVYILKLGMTSLAYVLGLGAIPLASACILSWVVSWKQQPTFCSLKKVSDSSNLLLKTRKLNC